MSEAVDLATFDPIFIVGAPRSGTSLLRAMLSRHHNIGLSDETYFFFTVYRRCWTFGELSDPTNRQALIDSYLATQRVRQLKVDLSGLRDRLMEEGTSYPAFFAAMLRFYAEAGGKIRAGEKTPHHANYVDTLLNWYPNGRVIHLVRDPRDVCASLRDMPWGPKSATANAKLWVDLTAAAEQGKGNSRFRRIAYESIVDDPERTMRELCDFVGESYDPAMLSTTPVAVADKSWFYRSREAPNKERLGLWHRCLSQNEIRLIETVAGPLMTKMGYAVSGPPASAALRLLGQLQSSVET